MQKENKMGVMPVNKLLLSMSVPIMISMIVQALYNIVDSIYVAQLSENALSAVSLAFPIQNLMIAVATGTGVGVSAILSRALGAKDYEKANKAAGNSMLLIVFSWFIIAVIGALFSEPIIAAQITESADSVQIVQMGTEYLKIVSMVSFGVYGEIAFERLLQSTGRTVLSMVVQLVGAVINIILDPILIFGRYGFPELGVAGAAWATVIGQIIAMIIAVILHFALNKEIRVKLRHFIPDFKLIGRIYVIGIPSILMVAIGSVMNFLLNKILSSFTTTAVAVFGAYFKLQSFVFMPVFGLNNGMVPILAYNYGALRMDRIKKTIKLAMLYAVAMMIIGFAVFQLFPDALLGFFDASEAMMEIGRPALRTLSFSFLTAGLSVVSSSVYQAFGKSLYSFIVSFARQLVILIPIAYLMSLTGKLDLVWTAFPIAEMTCCVLCLIFLRSILKKIKQTIDSKTKPVVE